MLHYSDGSSSSFSWGTIRLLLYLIDEFRRIHHSKLSSSSWRGPLLPRPGDFLLSQRVLGFCNTLVPISLLHSCPLCFVVIPLVIAGILLSIFGFSWVFWDCKGGVKLALAELRFEVAPFSSCLLASAVCCSVPCFSTFKA